MESYLYFDHFDLVTPDGAIVKIDRPKHAPVQVMVSIKDISPAFMGFKIDPQLVTFNFKSTLAQLGLNATAKAIPGAIFCHKGRFISVWETKDDVQKALNLILKKI